MKKDIFIRTLNKVCQLYGVNKKDIFTKTKKQLIADARHLLYYICLQEKNFKISYIQQYMKEHGYAADHAEIIYGKNKISEMLSKDSDTQDKIAEIQSECISS
tara:strand:- start:441 stop:749 length:309 start_codon:yes stop_codon:yes gene_type:complete